MKKINHKLSAETPATVSKSLDKAISTKRPRDVQKALYKVVQWLAALPPVTPEKTPEEIREDERRSKITDIYEKIGNHTGFIKEQMALLVAADSSDFGIRGVGYTIWQIEDKLSEIDKLREEWFNLDRPKKQTEQENSEAQEEKAAA